MKTLSALFLIVILPACATTTLTEPASSASARQSIQLDNGESLYYQVRGATQAGAPFVLLHGFAGSSDSWSDVSDNLAAQHPVYAIDLAGYGESDWPDDSDFSIEAQAGYVNQLVTALDIRDAIIVGHDIGGGVAQILAVRHPQRVKALVLANSVVDDHWPSLEVRMLRTPGFGYAGITLLEQPIWNHMLRKGFHDDTRITELTRYNFQHRYQDSAGRHRLVHNAQALDTGDLMAIQDAIYATELPTLVLWAEQDHFLDEEPAREMCKQMPDCEFQPIADTGHFLVLENPAGVSERLLQFADSRD